MKKGECFVLVVLCCCCGGSWGWWDTGHMIVAQIAWRHLTNDASNDVLDSIESSLKAFQTYSVESSTFVTSAVWMDDIKKKGISQFSSWHFINLPYCVDNTNFCAITSVESVLKTEDNVGWAIKEALNTIKSKTAGGFERGFALKNLIHLVGDAHQPLHVLERYSKETPDGDAGGNGFRIRNGAINNLHSFWDAGAGLFNNSLKRPLDKTSQQYIADWAGRIIFQSVISNYTYSTNITEWLLHGYNLAPLVYNLSYDSTPSPQYTLAAQQVILQQLGTAGYHLALLLKQIVPCDSQSNNCPLLCTPTPEDGYVIHSKVKFDLIAVAALIGSALVGAVATGYMIFKKQQWREMTLS